MKARAAICNLLSTAIAATFLSGAPLRAQETDLSALFEALRNADPASGAQIEQRIWEEWSRSGSAAMDLLLDRGRRALQEGEYDTAIEHFSALIDHAPDFAEGYNARATAFFQADRYGPALEDIRQALARNPQHFGAMSGLALILEELGEVDGALLAWTEVAKYHPHREGLSEAVARLERKQAGRTL